MIHINSLRLIGKICFIKPNNNILKIHVPRDSIKNTHIIDTFKICARGTELNNLKRGVFVIIIGHLETENEQVLIIAESVNLIQ